MQQMLTVDICMWQDTMTARLQLYIHTKMAVWDVSWMVFSTRDLGSVAERNFRPHVNCVRPTPDNKYLCAVDNGIDQVKIYRINKRRHKLELV